MEKKQPKQLEKVYLLNVLLYIDSLESIKKFILINKKCEDVSRMLRLYTPRRDKDSDSKDHKIIPRNLFTLFPMIETIQCDEYQMSSFQYRNKMENITFIDLDITDFDCEADQWVGIQLKFN